MLNKGLVRADSWLLAAESALPLAQENSPGKSNSFPKTLITAFINMHWDFKPASLKWLSKEFRDQIEKLQGCIFDYFTKLIKQMAPIIYETSHIFLPRPFFSVGLFFDENIISSDSNFGLIALWKIILP